MTIPILDQLQLAAWTAWTPALTASTTNPTLGTGSTASGRMIRLGSLVIASFEIWFGTSGSAAGAGVYYISQPVAARSGNAPLGHGQMIDASAAIARQFELVPVAGAKCEIHMAQSAADAHYVTNGNPWAWAASDRFLGQFMYEAA